ncbi:hydroxyethylthiazole kinase (plasmid) [Nicoliella spurrieriana]|uniref:Hydroxyethylthiazole kinase n=1 Tax=Nicoliella spurrieriana TaxID=2925830 RepID=A0A976X4J9_9LACO|nr:hydroxyethylthiazole kinase [Nicoliella spurrieriana]UQS85993.1 hydroxyethylthiazole kinase [Nicoliella spurrieriana]
MLTIDSIRKTNPVILNVANMVTPQHVADAINFYGGSPIMFTDEREAKELTNIASGVVFNMGSTNESTLRNVLASGKVANKRGIPVVIDPVAVGVTELRQANFKRTADEVHFDVIRGNAGEIAYLANVNWQVNGIDAGNGSGDVVAIAKQVAQKYDCWVVLSGPRDIVTDGNITYSVDNGHPYFQTNVGSGDMLDGILATAISVENNLKALVRATATFSIAGELAGEEYPHQPASFFVELFNQLATISDDEIDTKMKIHQL